MRTRRRRLRVLWLRALRVARRHYVSLLSATVLAGAAGVVLTSASFELAGSPANGAASAAVEAIPAPGNRTLSQAAAVPTPERTWRLAIVYLVEDEAHGQRIIETYSTLVWDNRRPDDFRAPLIRYLVAGTPEAELDAIRNLNYFLEVATVHQFDLQVVDLRPGRGVAADRSEP
jgi:hypothetical protein